MKIASLWMEHDGELVLKPTLRQCDDPALKEQILEFLQGGGLVFKASLRREDRLDPSAPAVVPLGYKSDGEWIWPLELAYYLEAHDLLPEDDLLDHARDRSFQAAEPSPSVLGEASRLLTSGE